MNRQHPMWGRAHERLGSPPQPGSGTRQLLVRPDGIAVLYGLQETSESMVPDGWSTADGIGEAIAALLCQPRRAWEVALVVERCHRCSEPRGSGFRASGEAATHLVEPLTRRELLVLGHLDSLLSKAEIASALCVSVNTVKTHVKNIYRKLDADCRKEAVSRARDFQLL